MKVKLRAAVCWFPNYIKSKGRSYCSSDLFWKYSQNSPIDLLQLFFRPTCSWNDCSFPEYSLVGWSRVTECFFEPWISSKFSVGELIFSDTIIWKNIRQQFRGVSIGFGIDGFGLEKPTDCGFLRWIERIRGFWKHCGSWISCEFWHGFRIVPVLMFGFWVLTEIWIIDLSST